MKIDYAEMKEVSLSDTKGSQSEATASGSYGLG